MHYCRYHYFYRYVQDNGPAVIVGCVGFLVIGLLQLVLSLTISRMWTVLIFMYMMVVIGFLLFALAVPAFFVYEIVVSMYGLWLLLDSGTVSLRLLCL